MAKTKISEFSTTAGNNTDINSINIAEGCAPSGINDAIRELMRQLKEFQTGGAGDSVNSGGDFSVATNKFTVASASGNTSVAGTLGVTGTTTLTGALVANGNATLGDASGDTVTIKGTPTLEVNPTLSGGTANGVLYLNGSKVATSGSALTFDGTNLGLSNSAVATVVKIDGSGRYKQFETYQSGTREFYFGYDSTSLVGLIYQDNNRPITFGIAGSEAMRLTSTGLGIGTSSPGNKLVLNGAGAISAQITSTDSGGSNLILTASGTAGEVNMANGLPLLFKTSNTERMRLDSSGNLGLGVQPSAWALSGSQALQVKNASFAGYSNTAYLSANSYFNSGGGSVYIANGFAGQYTIGNGSHIWYTAASGTAGNAITFTQAMTLDASGNLLVGTTSAISSARLTLGGALGGGTSAEINNSDATSWIPIRFHTASTLVGYISSNTTTTSYNTSSDYRLKNITGPITTSGAYIDSLNPVEGTWKSDGSTFVGLIAHEVQEASRTNVVTGVKDGEEMQGMDYSSAEIIANLIAELQSLRARVAALES